MQQLQVDSFKNDEWISDEERPDPEELPTLPGVTLLVRPVSVKSKTKGGILIPDSLKDDMAYLTTVGRVLAVGDAAYLDKERYPNGAWCKVGDYVCYGKNVGTKLYYKGVHLIIIYEDQIKMIVSDPKELDTTYDLRG